MALIDLRKPERASQTLKALSRPRGHEAKIRAAIEALSAAGQLPDWLRPCEIIERCDAWLERQGCQAHERPSRATYFRFFAREMRLDDTT